MHLWAVRSAVGAARRLHLPVGQRQQEQDLPPTRIRIQPARRGDRADDRPAPGVEQQAAQRLALEQRRLLFGELRVGGRGERCRADLGVGLPAGDLGEVDVDEVVGVRLGLAPVVSCWPAYCLTPGSSSGLPAAGKKIFCGTSWSWTTCLS